MLKTTGMAPQELLELHEILISEAAAAQKMQASMAAIKDTELRAFVRDTVLSRQKRVTEIERLLSRVQTSGKSYTR